MDAYADYTPQGFSIADSDLTADSGAVDSEKVNFTDKQGVEDSEEFDEILPGNASSDEAVDEEDIRHIGMLVDSDYSRQTSLYEGGFWTIFRRASVNLILPFINGMMLGFGEILAHEIGFRYSLVGARVQPVRRMRQKEESKYL